MRLLIVGTGHMANTHATEFASMEGVELVGAIDTRPEVLRAFCDNHKIIRKFSSIDEALAWDAYDAVSVVTPDAAHKECSLPFVTAGKHVLCEKPLAPNYADACAMATAAETAGTIAMVHLTYRGCKALCKARELVQTGAIGQVKHIEASYLQSWLCQDTWGEWRTDSTWLWRLSTAHGSLGVLGDIGIHLLDFTCHGSDLDIAELHCRLNTFPKAPSDRIGQYSLDANDSAVLDMCFSNGALGVLHATRWASGHFNHLRLRIYGELGGIEVNFSPELDTLTACIGDDIRTCTWRNVDTAPVPTTLKRFADAVMHDGVREPSFRYAANLQKVLDLAFESSQTGNNQTV